MATHSGAPADDDGEAPHAGPRAVLRALDILRAAAARREGVALPELAQTLRLPKASLHRLLRTLDQGGYLAQQGGRYAPGRESFALAAQIALARPPDAFPACARPVLEWLARETGETVMLGTLSEQASEIVYVDVIESQAPLRFTLRTGNRRPLFSVAAGKAMLAFATAEAQRRYIAETDFLRFTADTTTKAAMPALLAEIRADAVTFDRNGIVEGAAAIASPAFDAQSMAVCAVAVAGPTERIEADRARIAALVRDAGERIARTLGFAGDYPPPAQGAVAI